MYANTHKNSKFGHILNFPLQLCTVQMCRNSFILSGPHISTPKSLHSNCQECNWQCKDAKNKDMGIL